MYGPVKATNDVFVNWRGELGLSVFQKTGGGSKEPEVELDSTLARTCAPVKDDAAVLCPALGDPMPCR